MSKARAIEILRTALLNAESIEEIDIAVEKAINELEGPELTSQDDKAGVSGILKRLERLEEWRENKEKSAKIFMAFER